MTNSTTEAGLWDIAKNFKDIPIILNDPKPGGKDRQDQLRILYDGGRDHTLAHGSRGHGINLVCASNNKYFNLIITEEPDRERILLVPFSSKVTTKMMADLVAKENTASECTSALIRAANYLSQEGHAWMEENIETVGAQFPSLHPRICVTLAAYHAGRTALLKTVGSEGVLSNDGEYDAFVRRLVDLNSAISDSSPNSSQELFPVVQISTTFAWMLDLCKQAAAGGVGSMEDLKANMKFVATRSKETELAIRMPFLVKHKMKETFDASKRLGFSLKTVYFNGERVFSYVINFSSLKSQHEELAAAIEKIWNFNKRSRLGTSQDSDSFTSSEEAAGRVLPASAPATLETTVTEGE
ncbi:hypothetical protein Ndes2437B_g00632 [Nannochloris sp. 'desiccata']